MAIGRFQVFYSDGTAARRPFRLHIVHTVRVIPSANRKPLFDREGPVHGNPDDSIWKNEKRLVGVPGFEPEPRAPKARMPALTPYPAMVGSAALESASQPFQSCATPSQLTPQTLTHDPLLQDEEGTRGYGVFLFLRSNRSLHHSSNDGEDAIRTSFKDSRPVIEHPALTR